jgi:hypothetical protein
MRVVIAQCDTLPPVLPVATGASSTDFVVVNQSGVTRTVTLELILEALMAVDFTPLAVSVGTTYDNPVEPVGNGPMRKALAIQNASPSAGVYVFFGTDAPEDDTLSWELGPGQAWPPAGVNSVSQDGVWLRATAAATPVVIMVG